MVASRRVGDERGALRQNSSILGSRRRDVQCAALGRLVLGFVAQVVGQGSLQGCRILDAATRQMQSLSIRYILGVCSKLDDRIIGRVEVDGDCWRCPATVSGDNGNVRLTVAVNKQ